MAEDAPVLSGGCVGPSAASTSAALYDAAGAANWQAQHASRTDFAAFWVGPRPEGARALPSACGTEGLSSAVFADGAGHAAVWQDGVLYLSSSVPDDFLHTVVEKGLTVDDFGELEGGAAEALAFAAPEPDEEAAEVRTASFNKSLRICLE